MHSGQPEKLERRTHLTGRVANRELGCIGLLNNSTQLRFDDEDITSPKPAEPEYPMTVPQAARFLGVSPQTVYLWVERKQIPHFRVMGRNIRFLQSDLDPFRATFKQEVGIGKTE